MVDGFDRDCSVSVTNERLCVWQLERQMIWTFLSRDFNNLGKARSERRGRIESVWIMNNPNGF